MFGVVVFCCVVVVTWIGSFSWCPLCVVGRLLLVACVCIVLGVLYLGLCFLVFFVASGGFFDCLLRIDLVVVLVFWGFSVCGMLLLALLLW